MKVPGKKRKPKNEIIFITVLSDCVASPMRTWIRLSYWETMLNAYLGR
jgi:hypothetical protein